MKSEIAAFFSEHVPAYLQSIREFERRIPADARPHSDEVLEDLSRCMNDSLRACARLEVQLQGEDPLVLKEVQLRYREAILPSLNASWVFNRSVTKPRGYPG